MHAGNLHASGSDPPDPNDRPSGKRRTRRIFDAHWTSVGRFLRHLGLAEQDIEDALQQVFLVASDRLDPELPPASERTFLYRSAIHVAAQVRRRYGRSREEPTEDVDLAEEAPSADDLLDRHRALAMLHSVLLSMPEELRSIFVLYEIEELTMASIAEILQVAPGTVASRLRRAREQFREQVDRQMRTRRGP